MKIAIYLRVSTQEQNTDLQRKELLEYVTARSWFIYKIYEDKATGTNSNRPELKLLLNDAKKRKFDIVLCWKLDRFFRSLKDLINTLQELSDLGIQFASYRDNLDLTTATGRLMTQIIGAFAEFEASMIKERVLAGLREAKRKNIKLGRPKQRDDKKILLLHSQGLSFRKIAMTLNISKSMVQRSICSVSKPPANLISKSE